MNADIQEIRKRLLSQDYFDIFIDYNGNLEFLKQYADIPIHIMNPVYAVGYVANSKVSSSPYVQYGYQAIPKCYSLQGEVSLDVSGVTKLRRIPAYNYYGNGVLVGIIDTGIDYTNPLFLGEDGKTRIQCIWDQSIQSQTKYPETLYPVYYGTEYHKDQIDDALQSEDPFAIVPTKDENGHGTMLAGIAAGDVDKTQEFSGVVPEAQLVVVKLKQAKENLRNLYSIPSGTVCFQENDIIWGLQYLVNVARRMEKPMAICLGVGTIQGAHDDSGVLNHLLSLASEFPDIAIAVPAGNEGSTRKHFFSMVEEDKSISVELNSGETEQGFVLEFWGNPPMIYDIDIVSPHGEYIPRITRQLMETRAIRFVFEETIIYITNLLIEDTTGKQVIILHFIKPTPGVWRFGVYGSGSIKEEFHMWLSTYGDNQTDTYFYNANPYTTITSPGNCLAPITVTAYNPYSLNIYTNAGRGYSTSNILNPDIAAPGVNVLCPTLNKEFTTLTGTSAATAHVAGIMAIMLEWGVVKNHYPNIDTIGIKKFLIRGAQRSTENQYPNRTWGYGRVDLYNTFNILKSN